MLERDLVLRRRHLRGVWLSLIPVLHLEDRTVYLTRTAMEHWPFPQPHTSGISPLLREDLSIGLSFQCFNICIYINGRKKYVFS